MHTWFIILSVIMFVTCIAINIMILMQKKKNAGMSAGAGALGQSGGSGGGDTYWEKNKGRSLEGKLERYTKIAGAFFMVIALILNVLY
ncbi:MAG: preprotein translocase subunit SecG [Defluviitaleaceae bacterium]|nr:preprotein translocase subunit SecG [Defluviitaleaceae bacterium]